MGRTPWFELMWPLQSTRAGVHEVSMRTTAIHVFTLDQLNELKDLALHRCAIIIGKENVCKTKKMNRLK